MKIISWNVNGIRAVYKRNFLQWLTNTRADIICLQEIKAQQDQFPDDLLAVPGYYLYLNSGVKRGYSGTAVYTKQKPEKIKYQLGFKRFDQEGRIIRVKYPKFTLINVYLPHGGRGKENLAYKLKAYQYLFASLNRVKDKNIVLIGDFNVAHQEIDLARPKQNQNNIMFTPEERRQIDKLISMGFIDVFRKFNKEPGHYTWWPYAFNARERNLGWRIDYIFASESMALRVKHAFILDKIDISDHSPVGIEIRT